MNTEKQQRLLVLTSRFPYPLEKGDKLRVYHQIRLLSQHFEVILVSLHEGKIAPEYEAEVRKYCDKIHLLPLSKWQIGLNVLKAFFSGQSIQVAYFYSQKLQNVLNVIIEKEKPDRIYVQLIRAGRYVEKTTIPKIIDFMDVFSGQMKRRAMHSHWLWRWLFLREARQMARIEEQLFHTFDAATIISEQDRAQLDFEENTTVHIVPNGINTRYFSPRKIAKTHDVVFVGNMGYHPNVVAAQFLVKKIMPLVWQKNKNVRVLLAGARPAVEVRRLSSERVEVSGWMDDIRNAYAGGRVFVAPLFLGSGQQNKILEAMSMGLPCVTTPMVNNAIGGVDGESVLLANDESGFAQQILRILQGPEQQIRVGKAASAFVAGHFSWEQSVGVLSEVIRQGKPLVRT